MITLAALRHVGTIVLLLVLTSAALAQGSVGSALIVEVSGPTTPAVKPFTEVPANTTVSLAPGAKLGFVHYETCRTVSVTGGKVTIGAKGYQAIGGTVSETRTPCPRSVKVQGGGEAAGLVLRGVPQQVALATRPSFVIVGARADEISSVEVKAKDGDAPVLRAPITGPRFDWPADAAPLKPDTRYDLVFTFKDSTVPPVRQSIVTRDAAAETIMLIRVD